MFKKLFFKILGIKILKSRINGKEFVDTTHITGVIIFAMISFAMIFGSFFVFWFFETPIRNHPNFSLAISMGVFIFCAHRILKKEPRKDRNEEAFMQLLEHNGFLKNAGVPEEILFMMRIPINLSLAQISDFQRKTRKCSPTLPDEFFSSMRKIVEKINNKIVYEV